MSKDGSIKHTAVRIATPGYGEGHHVVARAVASGIQRTLDLPCQVWSIDRELPFFAHHAFRHGGFFRALTTRRLAASLDAMIPEGHGIVALDRAAALPWPSRAHAVLWNDPTALVHPAHGIAGGPSAETLAAEWRLRRGEWTIGLAHGDWNTNWLCDVAEALLTVDPLVRVLVTSGHHQLATRRLYKLRQSHPAFARLIMSSLDPFGPRRLSACDLIVSAGEPSTSAIAADAEKPLVVLGASLPAHLEGTNVHLARTPRDAVALVRAHRANALAPFALPAAYTTDGLSKLVAAASRAWGMAAT